MKSSAQSKVEGQGDTFFSGVATGEVPALMQVSLNSPNKTPETHTHKAGGKGGQ